MDSFTVIQTKEIEDREALKQMQTFLKTVEASQAAATNDSDNIGNSRIDASVIQQITTVHQAIKQDQSK